MQDFEVDAVLVVTATDVDDADRIVTEAFETLNFKSAEIISVLEMATV